MAGQHNAARDARVEQVLRAGGATGNIAKVRDTLKTHSERSAAIISQALREARQGIDEVAAGAEGGADGEAFVPLDKKEEHWGLPGIPTARWGLRAWVESTLPSSMLVAAQLSEYIADKQQKQTGYAYGKVTEEDVSTLTARDLTAALGGLEAKLHAALTQAIERLKESAPEWKQPTGILPLGVPPLISPDFLAPLKGPMAPKAIIDRLAPCPSVQLPWFLRMEHTPEGEADIVPVPFTLPAAALADWVTDRPPPKEAITTPSDEWQRVVGMELGWEVPFDKAAAHGDPDYIPPPLKPAPEPPKTAGSEVELDPEHEGREALIAASSGLLSVAQLQRSREGKLAGLTVTEAIALRLWLSGPMSSVYNGVLTGHGAGGDAGRGGGAADGIGGGTYTHTLAALLSGVSKLVTSAEMRREAPARIGYVAVDIDPHRHGGPLKHVPWFADPRGRWFGKLRAFLPLSSTLEDAIAALPPPPEFFKSKLAPSGHGVPHPRRIILKVELPRPCPAADLAWVWGRGGPRKAPTLLVPPGATFRMGPTVTVEGGLFILSASVVRPAKTRSYEELTTKVKRRVLGLGWNLAVRADEVAVAVSARVDQPEWIPLSKGETRGVAGGALDDDDLAFRTKVFDHVAGLARDLHGLSDLRPEWFAQPGNLGAAILNSSNNFLEAVCTIAYMAWDRAKELALQGLRVSAARYYLRASNAMSLCQHNAEVLEDAVELRMELLLLTDQGGTGVPLDVIAGMKNDMATFLRQQGDLDGALNLCTEAAELRTKALGGEAFPSVAAITQNIGNIYFAQGQYSEAVSMYREALQTVIDTQGEETLLGATLMNNMGLCRAKQNEPKKAQKLYERAIAIRTALLGPSHPDVAVTLYNLANERARSQEFERAATLFARAAEIYTVCLGPQHADSLESLDKASKCRAALNPVHKLRRGVSVLKNAPLPDMGRDEQPHGADANKDADAPAP